MERTSTDSGQQEQPKLLLDMPVEILSQVVSNLGLDAQKQFAAAGAAARQLVLDKAQRISLHVEQCISSNIENNSNSSSSSTQAAGQQHKHYC
jgi:hypothetical protein